MYLRYTLVFCLLYVNFNCHSALARIQKRDLLELERRMFQELQNKLETLKMSLESRSCNEDTPSGSTFTRWGRTRCPENNTELVYSGHMGGSYFQHEGAAVDYLCMPENPDSNYKYKDGVSTYRGYVFGAEYESRDNDVDIDQTYLDKDVPCAVCRIIGSTSVLMIPGKTKCENSWSEQYSGYLMSGRYLHKAASQYICVDKDAEVIPGSSTPTDGVLVYPVEVRCGSLKCPPYSEGRELACVVCSK